MRLRATLKGRRLLVAGTALLIAASLSGRVAAQPPLPAPPSAEADDPDVLERSLYKTLIFEGATNAFDLLLFGSLLGGHLYAGPAFVAVNATAAAAIYYGHEVAWGYLGPDPDEYEVRDNLLKGVTFRLSSSTRAFAIGYGFTGDPLAAAGFTAASAVGETVMYVASEYGWEFYDRLRETGPQPGVAAPARLVPAAWTVAPVVR